MRYSFLLALIFLLVACAPLNMPSVEKEIKRITSPDGRVDAVIVTSDAGATTGVAYSIFIVPKGAIVSKDREYPVFTADKVNGLLIQWQEAKHLKVTYCNARIFKFTNFWQSREMDNFQYEVKIKEIELSTGA